ncbi:hypothetical protein HLB03_05575, partial [Acidianus sp. DSM 29099]|nr:hypothetical protein [Acidianus sp. RZ1]
MVLTCTIGQLEEDILYTYDKGPWYNMLTRGIKHEKFEIRNTVGQAFRIVKH